jgi:hypothetical protein
VIDVTQLSPAELAQAVNAEGRVICAWCFSERATRVLQALGNVR